MGRHSGQSGFAPNATLHSLLTICHSSDSMLKYTPAKPPAIPTTVRPTFCACAHEPGAGAKQRWWKHAGSTKESMTPPTQPVKDEMRWNCEW